MRGMLGLGLQIIVRKRVHIRVHIGVQVLVGL